MLQLPLSPEQAMSAQVICISRSLAAGGEEIGQGVAARLGFRVIDSEIIERAAEKAELDPARVAQTEQRQSLIRRLIASMVPAAVTAKLGARYYAAYPVVALTLGQSREERLRGLIREVIEEVAAESRAVIVAHAASMALAGRDGVLRVLITASPEERAERLVWASGLDRGIAEQAVRNSDLERAHYFRRFYHLDAELPTHYDLVVNTDRLPPEEAVAIIVAAAVGPAPP
jgi:cytidylate kinase